MLKYVGSLGVHSQTRALSLRLLCDVATVQPKAFPYLIEAIHSYAGDTTTDVAVAKAKAVHHICDLRWVDLFKVDVSQLDDLRSDSRVTALEGSQVTWLSERKAAQTRLVYTVHPSFGA